MSARIPMRAGKDTSPDRNTVDGTERDAECEDEKLQECYYRHELPKAGCVFQPVGNVPLRFAARGMLFALQTCSIFYIEMRCKISSRDMDVIPYKNEYIRA